MVTELLAHWHRKCSVFSVHRRGICRSEHQATQVLDGRLQSCRSVFLFLYNTVLRWFSTLLQKLHEIAVDIEVNETQSQDK